MNDSFLPSLALACTMLQIVCLLALITQSAAFVPSVLQAKSLALKAVKTAQSQSSEALTSRLKRTNGFVDWAKESGIK
jgi:hypothetical protein